MQIKILILSLALASLACLQTAMTAQSEPTSAPSAASTPLLPESAPRTEIESGEVFEIQTCAIVTAIRALNLREQPSEKSKAISWLPARTIVVVVGRVGDWWKVESAVGTGYPGEIIRGYARAKYLQESECE